MSGSGRPTPIHSGILDFPGLSLWRHPDAPGDVGHFPRDAGSFEQEEEALLCSEGDRLYAVWSISVVGVRQ